MQTGPETSSQQRVGELGVYRSGSTEQWSELEPQTLGTPCMCPAAGLVEINAL